MRYTIKQSNIAALIFLTIGNEEPLDYVHIDNDIIEGSPLTERIMPFIALPNKVQRAIRNQFNTVMAAPLEFRGEVVKTQALMPPLTIDI